jgi:hypothetical protein
MSDLREPWDEKNWNQYCEDCGGLIIDGYCEDCGMENIDKEEKYNFLRDQYEE